MAELPVIDAAMNFVTAINELPRNAAIITFLDAEEDMKNSVFIGCF